METEAKAGIHPLVATASVAVIVLAAVGVAAFTGLLPGSSGSNSPAPAASAPASTEAKAVAPAPAQPQAADTKPEQPQAHKTETAKPRVAEAKAAHPKAAAPKPTQVAAAPHAAPAPSPKCLDCGVVESVQEVDVKGQATGAGAVAGGVAGAVIGNQIGDGRTRTVARLLGAAGGAFVGHQVEKDARSTKRYDIAVRMEEGGELRTLSQEQPPTWRAGDKVRVVNDALQAR
jgi:outer membrane lipoprotein SlyB